MNCPDCGGHYSEPDVSGGRRCTSPVTGVETIMVPDPGRPGLLRPLDLPYTRDCGYVFDGDDDEVEAEDLRTATCTVCDDTFSYRHNPYAVRPRAWSISKPPSLCPDCSSFKAELYRRKTAAEAAAEEERREAERAKAVAVIEGAAQLLSEFLAAAAQAGWPGTRVVYHPRDTSELTELYQERKNAEARERNGWNRRDPYWWERRAERRTRPPVLTRRVYGRGWPTGLSVKVGTISRGPLTAADDILDPVYLMSDGAQVVVEKDGCALVRNPGARGPTLQGGDLASFIRILAATHHVPLQAATD